LPQATSARRVRHFCPDSVPVSCCRLYQH
jgi:hypothetical protein